MEDDWLIDGLIDWLIDWMKEWIAIDANRRQLFGVLECSWQVDAKSEAKYGRLLAPLLMKEGTVFAGVPKETSPGMIPGIVINPAYPETIFTYLDSKG